MPNFGKIHTSPIYAAFPLTKLTGSSKTGLINTKPWLDRGKLNEVVRCQFVVARCNPTTLFDPVEEPLDPVSGAVETRAEADRIDAIAFRRMLAHAPFFMASSLIRRRHTHGRQAALPLALRHLNTIIAKRFANFGSQPWFIENILGAPFVKRSHEANPFVRAYVIPRSGFIGPLFGMELTQGVTGCTSTTPTMAMASSLRAANRDRSACVPEELKPMQNVGAALLRQRSSVRTPSGAQDGA